MRIVAINQFVGEPRFSPPYRTNYLANEWSRMGHDVTIICASFSHLFHSSPSFHGLIKEEINNGVRYLYIKTPKYKGNGIGRILNLFVFILLLTFSLKWLGKKIRPEMIISASVYPIEIFPAYLLAKMNKSKIIREVRDLWPLTLIEFGGLSLYNPFVILLGVAERFSYRHSHKVITTLSHSKDHMIQNGLSAGKWCFIPQGYDFDQEETENCNIPELHDELIKTMHKQGKFIVAYCGGHGIANALHSFVETAALMKDKNVVFLLIGQGPEKKNLQRMASEMNLTNIFFLPPVPKSVILKILQKIDACYHGTKNNPIYRFGVSPNKLMDYLASSKPIINAVNTPNDVVSLAQCGITIGPENPAMISHAIVSLIEKSPSERVEMGRRGREYLLNNHNYKLLAEQYMDEIGKTMEG